MIKKELEKDIQLAICDYLKLKHYFFWRENNTPIFDRNKNLFRAMPKYSIQGVPDIILIKDGKFIGIEVKRKGNKQSETQVKFQRLLELAGGRYYLVYSLDDVIKIL